jgi:hypothetical protein
MEKMSIDRVEVKTLRLSDQETFARQGYLPLPGLLEPALSDFLWSYVHTKFACRLLSVGDDGQVRNTLFAYGDPAFDGLLEYLRPRIEGYSGLCLLPTYSYFRLYKHGDILKRHRDRPACEVSVSLNIGQLPSDVWPLYVEGNAGPYGALLSPGDGLLYRGIDIFHWREPFQGNRLVQVFLHYVDRNGPHADEKFDRRITLMRPLEKNTAGLNQARPSNFYKIARSVKAIWRSMAHRSTYT